MTSRTGFYIGGEWVTPAGSRTQPLINPATEEVCGELALGEQADVDRAVKAARDAFAAYADTPLADRIALLRRIVDLYKSRFDDIGESISRQMGAPRAFATRFQAGAGLSHFKQVAALLESHAFEHKLGATRVMHEPIGVCGMIVPWNWPMNQITCKVGPALAAGCTMVLKASELAPDPAIILAEILDEAGVPPGVFNLIQGEGPVVGAALAAHSDVDMISFTGSTNAGIAVAQAAAPTVKRVGQELGGKSANILLDGIDFEDAVTRGVQLCFRNAGQSCNSPTRMLVPASRLAEVEVIAARTAEKTRVGHPDEPETVLGPVVSAKQWQSIQRHIERGIEEGATLVHGGPGRPDGLARGYFVKPTVFSNVKSGMTIEREEIFGPVLSIMPYTDDDEAIAIANDTPFGLAAYVEAPDLERARSVARKLRVGMVHLNGAPADPAAPFGGYRQSGNGREWGEHGLAEFTETKAVMGYGEA
ncbi:MAG: aldehyde dehydrogenase family protein [Pseudomonadota bacterium]